jgi:hypothetical protein
MPKIHTVNKDEYQTISYDEHEDLRVFRGILASIATHQDQVIEYINKYFKLD